ncbi:hypothetical protein LDO31_10550 [Luteimonas sp. XNQY3]|nr:hypothetical protein [Luteimonas sp. XNQY3]MCD9006667.1 hypothetical protein [Luteimonas sp. XNQY3]
MRKLIDVVDERIRWMQQAGLLTSMGLLASAVGGIVTRASPLWLTVPAALLGVGFLVLVGTFRQRWELAYKGHEIRFENSPFTGERLFLDGGLVARGGVGMKMEMRAPIRVGDGAGEELVALVDAGLRRFRLRLFADGAAADEAPVVVTAGDAPVARPLQVTQSGVVGHLVVAKQVMELLASLIAILGGVGALLLWLKA